MPARIRTGATTWDATRARWERSARTAAERFDCRYGVVDEFTRMGRILSLAERTREVHVLMNNCRSDYAHRNARQMADLLQDARSAGGRHDVISVDNYLLTPHDCAYYVALRMEARRRPLRWCFAARGRSIPTDDRLASDRTVPAPSRTLPRVLLAHRDPAARVLERFGLEVDWTAAELLEATQRIAPDAIIVDMDLSTPELAADGEIRRIKAEPETSHIPILALVAWTPAARAKAHASGCDVLCEKPCAAHQLAELVRRLIRRRKRKARRAAEDSETL